MRLSLAKILNSASFWAAIAIGLKVGTGLLVLPIALKHISQQEMGLYYTCTGLTSLLLVLDFGFSTTISRFASYAFAGANALSAQEVPEQRPDGSPNLTLLARVASGARWFYIFMAISSLLGLLALGTPFVLRLIEQERLDKSLLFFWIFLLVSSAIQMVSTVWVSILSGSGRVLDAQRISALGQLVGTIFMATALLSGWGLWTFPTGIAVSALFCWFTSFILLKRVLAGNRVGWGLVSCRELVFAAWPMAWRAGVSGIGTYLAGRYLVVIVANRIDLSTSASYGLAIQFFSVLAAVAFAPLAVVYPKINMLRVHKEVDSIAGLFCSRLYLGVVVFALGIGVTCFFGPSLLGFIGSKTALPSLLYLALIGLMALLDQHQYAYRQLVLTTNVNPFVFCILFAGLISCGLSWVLAPWGGLLGVLLVQIFAQLLFSHVTIFRRALVTIQIRPWAVLNKLLSYH